MGIVAAASGEQLYHTGLTPAGSAAYRNDELILFGSSQCDGVRYKDRSRAIVALRHVNFFTLRLPHAPVCERRGGGGNELQNLYHYY